MYIMKPSGPMSICYINQYRNFMLDAHWSIQSYAYAAISFYMPYDQ